MRILPVSLPAFYYAVAVSAKKGFSLSGYLARARQKIPLLRALQHYSVRRLSIERFGLQTVFNCQQTFDSGLDEPDPHR